MLFNSFEFLLLFLPVALGGFHLTSRLGRPRLALIWLVTCSLVFHGYWKASYTWLFVVSIVANYAFAMACRPAGQAQDGRRRIWTLWAGLAFNLGLLMYFKYAGFLADLVVRSGGPFVDVGEIALPLAISFYTFQQVSFLTDTHAGRSPRYSFLQYASYLAFFPHLIAGPIVRHNDLIGQLSSRRLLQPSSANLISGTAIIMIGLFKKVVLADGTASFVNPVFFAASSGARIGWVEGWIAAVLFSFVIYFDFSGYSDIAIGLARLFNVRFPENFASPYKAKNIVDFWRRWHITLSAFLRDYLYIPLGGSRRGPARRFANLMVTMVLGGLWHGAALNFVLWGALHGLFLATAHVWRARSDGFGIRRRTRAASVVSRILTYLAVVFAWVFFRASTFDEAVAVLRGMIGLDGWISGVELPHAYSSHPLIEASLLCLFLVAFVNLAPNTQQFMRLYRPVRRSHREPVSGFGRRLVWQPGFVGAGFIALLGIASVLSMERVQAFMYFRF